jgi:hypothetical protein
LLNLGLDFNPLDSGAIAYAVRNDGAMSLVARAAGEEPPPVPEMPAPSPMDRKAHLASPNTPRRNRSASFSGAGSIGLTSSAGAMLPTSLTSGGGGASGGNGVVPPLPNMLSSIASANESRGGSRVGASAASSSAADPDSGNSDVETDALSSLSPDRSLVRRLSDRNKRTSWRKSIGGLKGLDQLKLDQDGAGNGGAPGSGGLSGVGESGESADSFCSTPRDLATSSDSLVSTSSLALVLSSVLSSQDMSDGLRNVTRLMSVEDKWRFVLQHRHYVLPILAAMSDDRDASDTFQSDVEAMCESPRGALGRSRANSVRGSPVPNRSQAPSSPSLRSSAALDDDSDSDADAVYRRPLDELTRIFRIPNLPNARHAVRQLVDSLSNRRKRYMNRLRFMESGGPVSLCRLFARWLAPRLAAPAPSNAVSISSCPPLAELRSDLEMWLEAVRLLCDPSCRAVVLASNGALIDCVVLSLRGGWCEKAFALALRFAETSPTLFFDSLSRYKDTHGEKFRVAALLEPFVSVFASRLGRVNAVHVLLTLLAKADGLKERFALRNEVMRAGFASVLQEGADTAELRNLLEVFEEAADEDFAAMVEAVGQEQVMKELAEFMAVNQDSTEANLRVTVYSLRRVQRGVTVAQYTPESSEAAIKETVVERFPITEKLEDYSLYIKREGKDDKLWRSEKPASHYKLAGPVSCDFLPTPYSLKVSGLGHKSAKMEVPPHLQGTEIMSEVFEHLAVDSEHMPEEYGLFVVSEGRFIEASLLEWPKSLVCEIRKRPRPITVDGVLHYFDDSLPIAEIVTTLGGDADTDTLFLTLAGGQTKQLEPSKPLAEYAAQLRDKTGTAVTLRARPITYSLSIPSESVTSQDVALDPTLTAREVVRFLKAKFECPTQADFSLVTDDGTPIASDEALGRDRRTISLVVGTDGEADTALSIWEEAKSDKYVRYEDGKLIAGTLNKLVEAMTSTETYDREAVDVFLMTYKAFASTDQVLRKLAERWLVPDSAGLNEDEVRRIRLRIGVFVKHWIVSEAQMGFKTSARDRIKGFVNEYVVGAGEAYAALARNLERAIADAVSDDGARARARGEALPRVGSTKGSRGPLVSSAGSGMIRTNSARRASFSRTSSTNLFANGPARSISSASQLTLSEVPEEMIAEQLALTCFGLYEHIEPPEFFNSAWCKAGADRSSPNVLAIIDNFNHTSSWVSAVLVSEPKLKKRARLLERLILIAKYLREVKCFHLLVAMLSAFNVSAISRLKHTFARLNKKTVGILKELEEVTSMEGAYRNYRAALEQVPSDQAAVPYLGVVLTDLTFIEEGNPNRIDNLIHFAKQRLVYTVIASVLRFQNKARPAATRNEMVQSFLKNMTVYDEKTLYAKSLEIEPRGITDPKQLPS